MPTHRQCATRLHRRTTSAMVCWCGSRRRSATPECEPPRVMCLMGEPGLRRERWHYICFAAAAAFRVQTSTARKGVRVGALWSRCQRGARLCERHSLQAGFEGWLHFEADPGFIAVRSSITWTAPGPVFAVLGRRRVLPEVALHRVAHFRTSTFETCRTASHCVTQDDLGTWIGRVRGA